jgi:hypothetical protein
MLTNEYGGDTTTPMQTFSTFQIVKALKIPRERLKDWMDRGFIKPSTPARGKGTKAKFTLQAVYAVGLFQELVESRIERKMAAVYVRNFLSATADEIDKMAYLVFQTEKKDGKEQLRTVMVNGGPDIDDPSWEGWKYDLKTGALEEPKFRDVPHPPKMRSRERVQWRQIFIVDVGQLKTRINEALGI